MRKLLLGATLGVALVNANPASAAWFSFGNQAAQTQPQTPVTQRAPTATDDWTKGYYSVGSLSGIAPLTLGVGCSSATVALSAPNTTGGIQATANARVVNGQVVNYQLTNPGQGYTSNPTVTVTGVGCTTQPTAFPKLAAEPLWNYGGIVYVGVETAIAGQAQWIPSQTYQSYKRQANASGYPNEGQLPCDAGSDIQCFSMNLASKNYTANKALDLTNSAGTVLTIGFVNGKFDAATANGFCYNTICKVTTWYDQIGTNNATAATATAPYYSPTNKIGDTPSIVFPAVVNGGSVSSYMSYTADATTYEQGNGGCVVYRAATSYQPTGIFSQTGGGTAFTMASPGQGGNAGTGLATTPSTLTGSGQSALNIGNVPRLTPNVTCWQTSNASAIVYDNDNQITGPAFNASTLTAGIIGASNTTTPEGYMEISSFIIATENGWYTSVPLATRVALVKNFSLTPQVRGLSLDDGDSLTMSYGSTYNLGRTRLMEPMLSKPINLLQNGSYGDTISHRLTVFGSSVGPAFDLNSQNNIVNIFAGTNDIQGGVAATTAYANLTTYVSYAKALGVKVSVGVMLPRGDLTAAQQTQWQTYQSLIRANSAGADFVIDYAKDTSLGGMGLFANTSNTLLYQTDTIHATPWVGYGIMAAIEANALSYFLQ